VWNARAHEAKKICLGVKHALTSGGASLSLGVGLVQEFQIFRDLVEKAKEHQFEPPNIIEKVLKCIYIKCNHIVRLELKCMSYDEKKCWDQIGNLTPNHKSFSSRSQMSSN
jgi:hypothetical protein